MHLRNLKWNFNEILFPISPDMLYNLTVYDFQPIKPDRLDYRFFSRFLEPRISILEGAKFLGKVAL